MKKFFRMLGLIILIGNIGFAEYTIKDGKVYWDDELVVKYVNGVFNQYNKFLPDVESFKILKDGYARDKNMVYIDGIDYHNVDVNTVKIIKNQEYL